MNLSDIYVLDETAKEPENPTKCEEELIDPTKPRDTNDKYQNLEVILGNLRENAKVLIFSSFESSFTNIVDILDRMNWTWSFLKGNGFHIQATIQRYKGDEVKVLLINTQNYGQGMNLENTTDLILFHKFDTEVEKQVIGRAQRYGRHQPLHVHYLLYDNEMPH
jgi:SNF2 family DNA or RNA helicase